jgi:hypothetical protein
MLGAGSIAPGENGMDDRRFDRLAHVVAASTSRRGLLRGLASALVLLAMGRRVPDVAAQTGYLGPGAPCTDGSQCGATRYNDMFCDDNGIANDGSLNCCAYEYGYCDDDSWCCGFLSCIQGSCGSTPQSFLSLGDQCFAAEQCLGGGDSVDCADNGGFVPACCLVGGQPCAEDLDCCMPNTCAGGFCQ